MVIYATMMREVFSRHVSYFCLIGRSKFKFRDNGTHRAMRSHAMLPYRIHLFGAARYNVAIFNINRKFRPNRLTVDCSFRAQRFYLSSVESFSPHLPVDSCIKASNISFSPKWPELGGYPTPTWCAMGDSPHSSSVTQTISGWIPPLTPVVRAM